MARSPDDQSKLMTKAEAIGDLRLTDNDPRYAAEQMVACGRCSRTNPPNRTACIYCGAAFEAASIDPETARVNFAIPEPWQDGFSLVYSGQKRPDDPIIEAAAETLQMTSVSVAEFLDVPAPVPLVYLRSLTDAGLLASRLSEGGFDCAIVGDDLLTPKVPPTRVRKLTMVPDGVVVEDFNTAAETCIRSDEPVLMVSGSLVKASFEMIGKRSRRTTRTTDESTLHADEPVLDIYPRSDVYGFRIRSAGFDFSCLAERKRSLAAANLSLLIEELRSRFPSGIYIDSYDRSRQLIDQVWPLEEIKPSSRVARRIFGGVEVRRVNVTDNSLQFTKFSRLQRHFL